MPALSLSLFPSLTVLENVGQHHNRFSQHRFAWSRWNGFIPNLYQCLGVLKWMQCSADSQTHSKPYPVINLWFFTSGIFYWHGHFDVMLLLRTWSWDGEFKIYAARVWIISRSIELFARLPFFSLPFRLQNFDKANIDMQTIYNVLRCELKSELSTI